MVDADGGFTGVADLADHQADAAEIAAWSCGHWIIENPVHWTKGVTFAEDASQVRRHTPYVMTGLRDLARATLHRAGWTNIASGRRAHSHPEAILALHGIPRSKRVNATPPGPWFPDRL